MPAASTGTLPVPGRGPWLRRMSADDPFRGLLDPRRPDLADVRPRNFSVTCQFSGGTQRASGNASRHGPMAAAMTVAGRPGYLDGEEESLDPGRCTCQPAPLPLSRASRIRTRERHTLQMPADEVEPRLLRPTADPEAFAGHVSRRA